MNGNSIPESPGLQLPLVDFAMHPLNDHLPDCSINIPPEILCTFLAEAEEDHAQEKESRGVLAPPWKRKRCTPEPEEQLTPAHEKAYLRQERNVRRKLSQADGAYGSDDTLDNTSSEEAVSEEALSQEAVGEEAVGEEAGGEEAGVKEAVGEEVG